VTVPVCVRGPKEKQLELSTPTMAGSRHEFKRSKVKGQGHAVIKCAAGVVVQINITVWVSSSIQSIKSVTCVSDLNSTSTMYTNCTNNNSRAIMGQPCVPVIIAYCTKCAPRAGTSIEFLEIVNRK